MDKVRRGSTTAGYDSSAARLPTLLTAYRKSGIRRTRMGRPREPPLQHGCRRCEQEERQPHRRRERSQEPCDGAGAPYWNPVDLERQQDGRQPEQHSVREDPPGGESQRNDRSAYRYPASSMNWKNSMHVVHTDAEPPSSGSRDFATSGWTEKRSAALLNSVTPYSSTIHRLRRRSCASDGLRREAHTFVGTLYARKAAPARDGTGGRRVAVP